jgi:SNF2 family DNA or RNA helicase
VPDFNSLQELLGYHKVNEALRITSGREDAQLRQDQIEDIENNFGFDRVKLFNEVGTGKTVTGTVLALAWDAQVNIVLMPPILLRQWQRWLAALHDAGSVLVYRGSPVERQAFDLRSYRWLLMTIQIFKKDMPRLQRAIGDLSRTIIVDEAHSIKNVGSANYKSVRDFSEGEHLVAMTGTPISAPGDAYAYVKLTTPHVYRSQAQFENLHVEERDFFGNVVRWQNLEQMNHNLMLQGTRRLSREVLKHLKDPNYIPIYYDLAPEHMALYNQLADEQLLLLPDGGKIDATSAGRLYNALQQIVVNWDHFSGDPALKSQAFDVIDMVTDEIDLAVPESSKLIVYTYYRMTSRKVTEYLSKFNAVACYSEIAPRQQERNLERFLTDPSCRVLVAQPGSGGVGFNPQAVCWELLFIEEPVIPKDFIQASGRVDRDGQQHIPNIRLAIAEGTIQRRLHDNLLTKDKLANKVQGGFKDLRDAIHGR